MNTPCCGVCTQPDPTGDPGGPGPLEDRVDVLERARRLRDQGRLGHAEDLFEHLTATLPTGGGSEALREHGALLNEAAVLHKATGRYDAAIAKYQRALTIVLVTDGPRSGPVATIYHNLGGIYHALGDHHTAEHYARHGIELRAQLCGPDHPDTIADIAAHAAILHGLGYLDDAEAALRHCLDSGACSDHDRAANLHNLAAIAHQRGDLPTAIDHFQAALDIKQQVFGPDHPELAATVHNLAVCHRDLHHPHQARRLFERVIELLDGHTRPDHPLLTSAHHNLTTIQSPAPV